MPSMYAYDMITKYHVRAVLTEPMHIGSGDGSREEILVHPVDRLPYVQAAGLAGAYRDWFRRQYPSEEDLLFGQSKDQENSYGRLNFSDGYFSFDQGIGMELRPRVSINPETGCVDADQVQGTTRVSGQKFNMEYVGAGAKLEYDIYLFGRKNEDKGDEVKAHFEQALAAMDRNGIQLGGQKSNGCGYLKLESLLGKTFEMDKAEDRKRWAVELAMEDDDYENWNSRLKPKLETERAYRIEVSGKTEGELLIKSLALDIFGKNAPDAAPMHNSAGKYIVPASSFKGTIRNRMEQIAAYLGLDGKLLKEIFGHGGEQEKEGVAGSIRFFDTVVRSDDGEGQAASHLEHRIHLDKFTAGVIHGGKFAEQTISGKLDMRIEIVRGESASAGLGLLIFALRDLAAGRMNLGSGYSVGNGFLSIESILIQDLVSGKEARILFESQETQDESGILHDALQALKARKENVEAAV